MIRLSELYGANFASSNINDMSNAKYQDAAMEYAMWYHEHLLRMEDVLGKKMEAKIEEILDRKIHEYLEIGVIPKPKTDIQSGD